MANSSMYKFFCSAILSVCWSVANAEVVNLYSENFELGVVPKTNAVNYASVDPNSQVTISLDPAQNYKNSAGSIKGNYPAPLNSGAYYIWAGFTLPQTNISDVYIEFMAKMPGNKHGMKFLKIMGQSVNGTYANTTFPLDYTGVDYGGMYCVAFGDGTHASNDTQNLIFFTGENPAGIGRSYKTASVLTPQKKMWSSSNWGTSWHHFRFHIKYNSGTTAATEVADGEYYVEIDGKVYVDAKGLLNRHYSNKPIDRIELYGWSQSGKVPFELWYDNISITTGGFLGDGNKPGAPISPILIN